MKGTEMNKTILLCVFGVLVLLAIAGCLAGSGAAAGFFASDSGSDDDDGSREPPDPEPVDFNGPSVLLDGKPVDVLIGEYSGDGHNDIAVALDRTPPEVPQLVLFENDGGGGFPASPDRTFDLGSTPFTMAKLPDENGCETLVVATELTLRVIRPCSGESHPHHLDFSEDHRDVAVGDFNGNQLWDVAITSPEGDVIVLFRGTGDGIEPNGAYTVDQPDAISSANFDNDPDGYWDLVVLKDDGPDRVVVLYASDGDFTFEEVARVFIPDAEPEIVSRDTLDPEDLEERSLFPTETDALDDDRHTDFAIARKVAISKIVVSLSDCAGQPQLTMTRPIRPTGPTGKDPRSPQLIRLPGGEEDRRCWGLVAIDSRPAPETVLGDEHPLRQAETRAFVIARYTDTGEDCLQADDGVPLPIPGEGEALSVGELNGDDLEDIDDPEDEAIDDFEDIAVVSDNPPTLSVLLSTASRDEIEMNDLSDRVREQPFFYPNALRTGENSFPGDPRGLDFGFASADETDPFLVTKGESGTQVVILLLDEGRTELEESVRVNLETKFDEFVVADLDGPRLR